MVVVSHDRYFLDRVAGRLFAFEAGGRLTQYICPFSDYLDARIAQEAEEKAEKQPVQAAPKRTRERELRMSYKEQRDYETIDQKMEQLQKDLEELDRQIEQNASDFVKLTELTQKREAAQQALDERRGALAVSDRFGRAHRGAEKGINRRACFPAKRHTLYASFD